MSVARLNLDDWADCTLGRTLPLLEHSLRWLGLGPRARLGS